MTTQSLFVNLPISELARTKSFFTALGFSFNSKFTGEHAACLVVNEHIHVMLLTRSFFADFTPKPVTDLHESTSAFMSLSVSDRTEVDELMQKAIAAGAIEHSPAKDHGFMYQRGFFDLDGHAWEIFYLNESEFPKP
jgi:predicted lactoylglutathione lyase